MEPKRSPIIALATAKGRASVGIVRLSGSRVLDVARDLLGTLPKPRHATLECFNDKDGNPIDQGLVIFFPGPNSYTGEDVLEFQCHGSVAALDLMIDRCLEIGRGIGLRLAQPGEFTERAFLNGKIDLAQAEAIADLIDASSALAAKGAAKSLTGEFSKKIHEFLDALIEIRALTEATLDFPEEEIDFIKEHDVLGRLEMISEKISEIKKSAQQGSIVRDGITVVLAGQPNVGKSSLLNALAGQEIAIVTSVAGTTRDRLKETILLDGIPLHIIDTAGLRDTSDEVEQIGIERTWGSIEQADVVLLLMDAQEGFDVNVSNRALLNQIDAKLGQHVPVKLVWNKADLVEKYPPSSNDHFYISAKHHQGLNHLKEALLQVAGWYPESEGIIFARKRHIEALSDAQAFVLNAIDLVKEGQTLDLAAEEMRLAQDALGKITGEFLPDDLLGKIFSTFCIGK